MLSIEATPESDEIRNALHQYAESDRTLILKKYFRSNDDIFLGVRVPAIRKLARKFADVSVERAEGLLCSPVHEERLLALLLLSALFRKSDQKIQKQIYHIYLKNRKHINNWDLVDCSAEHIIGAYLAEGSKAMLFRLAGSKQLWDRRIAILSTFHFIKKHEFATTLQIAEMLLRDPEDLIHKGVGWMLREVGNRDRKVEEEFLRKHCKSMPRTMLRYAIEKFPEEKRKAYLNK